MKVIHRHEIFQHGSYQLSLPADARIVHVGMKEDGSINVWEEHSEQVTSRVTRHFEIVETGHPFDDNARHIGTFLDGPYVWHLIEHGAA